MNLVEGRGCVQGQMRIIGHQGVPVVRQRTADGPLVAPLGLAIRIESPLEERHRLGALEIVLGQVEDLLPQGGRVVLDGSPSCQWRVLPCTEGDRSRHARGVRHGRSRIERGGAKEVLGEQRCAVESEEPAGLHIAQKGDRQSEIEIEGQAEGEQLGHSDGVQRRPGLELGDLQEAVLGRQRVAGDPGIDTVGIGLERCPHVG